MSNPNARTGFPMKYTIYDACYGLMVHSGVGISADEYLSKRTNHIFPIPFKTREELDQIAAKDNDDGVYRGDLMPKIDLKVLHYFLTQLCLQKYPHLANSMDETSLITVGMLVDKWVEDYFVKFIDDESEDELSSGSDDEDEYDDDDDDSQIKESRKKAKIEQTEDEEEEEEEDVDQFRTVISKGPARTLAKFLNYKTNPTDI